jgi:hypothetical protein
MEQFELLRRRIFVAKAERVDVTQLELEFERTKQKLAALAQKLDAEATSAGGAGGEAQQSEQDPVGSRPAGKPSGQTSSQPKGRRNLANAEH